MLVYHAYEQRGFESPITIGIFSTLRKAIEACEHWEKVHNVHPELTFTAEFELDYEQAECQNLEGY